MAKVTIETDDGDLVAAFHITNKNGPWTDGGEKIDRIVWNIDRALKAEGDEA
jgi:hypothetical protein